MYDARVTGREILTPLASHLPRITGPAIFGVRPGKPVRFRVSATGRKPLQFEANGLPNGILIDPLTGWITGRAPWQEGDVTLTLSARNADGSCQRTWILRVADTICLTPPMGWNSWYVHSEGVSDAAIREIATSMEENGLTDHGWSFVNIDDCWMGLRDQTTNAIQPNSKFPDIRALADFVNEHGLKLGIYSTPWMSTYAGFIGGSAPNEEGDYSEHFLPEEERQNPHQVFGRYPNSIRKGLATIGPIWRVDRDAQQFAEWGIDYVKYDWKEWTLETTDDGQWPAPNLPQHKTEAVTRRLHENFRNLDRDIVLSLSPDHDSVEDQFVPDYCNLWRLTTDIEPEWRCLIAPFDMEKRLQLTRPGRFGDLDMLQIGPLGKPNRAEVEFKPSPLTPSEQYFQVTLWCILTQPLLLSCHIPTMDAFDLNLVTNDEVLAINQDPLCKQGRRVANAPGEWEIWAKDLVDGSRAFAMFNLTDVARELSITREQLGMDGQLRDLWRQKDVGPLTNQFSAMVDSHGVVFLKIVPSPTPKFSSELDPYHRVSL